MVSAEVRVAVRMGIAVGALRLRADACASALRSGRTAESEGVSVEVEGGPAAAGRIAAPRSNGSFPSAAFLGRATLARAFVPFRFEPPAIASV